MTTNQRIYFDTHASDSNLVVTGGTDATVRFWDLKQPPRSSDDGDLAKKVTIEPVKVLHDLHSDCVNGVSLHPERSLLATCSGQRRLEQNFSCSDSDASDKVDFAECALKIWDFENIPVEMS